MARDKVEVNTGGLGFAGALTILFVALKLTGHIDWSWVWVLSPLWVGLAFFVAVMLAAVVGAAVIAGIMFLVGVLLSWRDRRNRKR